MYVLTHTQVFKLESQKKKQCTRASVAPTLEDIARAQETILAALLDLKEAMRVVEAMVEDLGAEDTEEYDAEESA